MPKLLSWYKLLRDKHSSEPGLLMPLSPAEQLAHSTIRIECDLANGLVSTGTGFFHALNRNGDEHVPVIVTNKHVINGAVNGRFLFTRRKDDGDPDIGFVQAYQLDKFESRWILHPDNGIDLCVLPIGPLLHATQSVDKFFFVSLEKDIVPTPDDIADMVGLENITMVGYPNGLWDQTNNLPIFRKGILASDYKYDWNGKKEFLIDAACFPGSSGSPVLLFDQGGYRTRNALVMGGRIKLLGILYAGPQHTIEGEVKIVVIPTQQKAVSVTGIPINLGIVIKASQLSAFENMVKQNS